MHDLPPCRSFVCQCELSIAHVPAQPRVAPAVTLRSSSLYISLNCSD